MILTKRGASTPALAAALLLVGCGGASYSYEAAPSKASAGGGGGRTQSATGAPGAPSYDWDAPSLADQAAGGQPSTGAPPQPAPSMGDEAGEAAPVAEPVMRAEADAAPASGGGLGGGLLEGAVAQADQPQRQLAQNAPQDGGDDTGGNGNGQPPETGGEAPEQPAETTDAVDTSGPLLIYTANLNMAVFQVEQTQEKIIDVAEGVDGYLQKRSDTEIVVRVPAGKFHETVEKIEELGDVLARNIQASDVSEQFRDISIRLKNAQAMRERLEKLLDEAETVEAALKIEREMQRITELIETLKGRLRFLSDRISFSTITVRFQPRPTEEVQHPDTFRLPFEWLDELGLSNLMRLQ